MVLMFTWELRRRLLWICMLLSSTFCTGICHLDQDESVAANTDEAGRHPVFVQEHPKEVKEAPISGFDFYSKDDYEQDWWEDYLRLNNEEELYPFPHVQDKKTNSAVNLKLGDDSSFTNSGDVGSNIIYDLVDSKVNRAIPFNSRGFVNMGFQRARPVRVNSRRTTADNYNGFLCDNHSHTRMKRMKAAVNLNLDKESKFGNKGQIGSNFVTQGAEIMKVLNMNQNETYSKEKYYPTPESWKLGTAVNLNLGSSSMFENTGSIGSNLVGNRNLNLLYEPKYYERDSSKLHFALDPEQLYSKYGIIYDNQGYIGSNVVENDRDTTYGGESRTKFTLDDIGSSTIQNRHNEKLKFKYLPNFQRQNMNSTVNLNSRYGTKFFNEGEIGSNALYIGARNKNMNNLQPQIQISNNQWQTMNSAANLDLGPISKFGNTGKIGSNIEVIGKPELLRSQNTYYPDILLNYPPNSRSENMYAAANLKASYGTKFGNEGEIGSNFLYFGAAAKYASKGQLNVDFAQPRWRTVNSAANLDLGPGSTFGNKGKIGSNIEVIRKPEILSPPKVLYYPELSSHYSTSSRSENFNAAANLKTNYGTKFGNEGEIGSNFLYNTAKRTSTIPIIYSEPYLPYLHRRTLNSGANVDLGQLSTFWNKGKIGTNIIHNRGVDVLGVQNPGMTWSYPESSPAENLNAATNLKTAPGAKFANEGEIGSNYLHIRTGIKDRNNFQPEVYIPEPQWRTMNSAANLDLGPVSTFGNRGKIGSNIEVIREPAMLRFQNTDYPEIPLNYSPSSRSQNVNAAANLKTAYGTQFGNEGEVGSNALYQEARRTTSPIPRIYSEPYLPYLHRRTLNSGANVDLGQLSTFWNKGKIGTNIVRNTGVDVLDLNAATNLKTTGGAKFANEGEVGSNYLHIRTGIKDRNNFQPEVYFPEPQWRTMTSAANLDLGPVSTFGNRGKIGSNIEVIRKPTMLRLQNTYYPEIPSNYAPTSVSQNLNAAANLKTAYGTNFGNEGEIGSNYLHIRTGIKDRNNFQPEVYVPEPEWRTMKSAANLDLGPVSMFQNRGKIGSNIEVIREPAMLRFQNTDYPEIPLKYAPTSVSQNLNAAANLKTSYGTKFGNEGEIGSNYLHIRTGVKDRNNFQPEVYFPEPQWRTMTSAANLDLGPVSTFGNKGKIGSNIEVIRKPAMLRSPDISYYPDISSRYYTTLRPENVNAAANLKTSYGTKFGNEGEIGSNYLHIRTGVKDRNNFQPEVYFPEPEWRTMKSAANLDLGPVSMFQNRGKIGSNIEVIREPAMFRFQNTDYPEIPMNYPPISRSQNVNAAANLKTAYGTQFGNEGEIGSNFVYNLDKRTSSIPEIYSEQYLPYLHRRTLNSGANVHLGQLSSFWNKGKMGSNIILNRGADVSKLQNRDYPGMTLKYPQSLRQNDLNAALNLHTAYGAKFSNTGEVGSNSLYNMGRRSGSHLRSHNLNAASNLKTAYGSKFYNEGEVGSNLLYNRNKRAINNIGETFSRTNQHLNRKTMNSEHILNSNYAFGVNIRRPPNFAPENMDSAANFGNVDSIGTPLLRSKYHDISLRHRFRQKDPEVVKSSANLNFEPGSYFNNKGDVGSTVLRSGNDGFIRNRGGIGSNSIFNAIHKVSGASGVPNFENVDTFVDAYDHNHPRFHHATSANEYKGNRLSRPRARNIHSAANLNLGTSARVSNAGTMGSTLIVNDDEVRRDTGRRMYHKSQYRTPSSYNYDTWALRTAKKNVNGNMGKGKGIVNIFMGSGSLFQNKGAFGNDRYQIPTLPSRIKLRGSKPGIASFAYIIPPSGKGRSALSDGKVVTGISTGTFKQQPSFATFNNKNDNYRNLKKHGLHERSSLINDGGISAAEILLSRGSVFGSKGSKTQMTKAPPAAVSFEKLGLDMTHSSNQASIVAGNNATIIINGKMGTYQVSIPIGSIVASEGSSVSLRSHWNYVSSESSLLGLRSSLNFLKHRNSIITGVVKVMSRNSYGHETAGVCELENPITTVEIRRPLLSDTLLLRLLLVTKLRTNLANVLSYLTAINTANIDERLYVSLQKLYNAIQYRQINLLPLLLLNQYLNTIPHKHHFRAMLELLENVAPLNVKYIIHTLIQGIEKQAANYIDISENLIPLLTDTLDVDMIPDTIAQQHRNVLFGDMDVFVNQVVDKVFSKINRIRSVRELKDIIYLTMLNLPLSYSVPQLPTKLRLVAHMLLMELTDDVWAYAAMRAQHIPSTNVYLGLKNFLNILVECPIVPANMRAIVWDTMQILPDAMPMNDIHDLSITNFAPITAKGDNTLENRGPVPLWR